jgi:hypothetical protein
MFLFLLGPSRNRSARKAIPGFSPGKAILLLLEDFYSYSNHFYSYSGRVGIELRKSYSGILAKKNLFYSYSRFLFLLGSSRNRNAKKLFRDLRQGKAILFLLEVSIPTRPE